MVSRPRARLGRAVSGWKELARAVRSCEEAERRAVFVYPFVAIVSGVHKVCAQGLRRVRCGSADASAVGSQHRKRYRQCNRPPAFEASMEVVIILVVAALVDTCVGMVVATVVVPATIEIVVGMAREDGRRGELGHPDPAAVQGAVGAAGVEERVGKYDLGRWTGRG